MILCHGQQEKHHAPTEFEFEDSEIAGHATMICPNCGTMLETGESTARMVKHG